MHLKTQSSLDRRTQVYTPRKQHTLKNVHLPMVFKHCFSDMRENKVEEFPSWDTERRE